MVLKTYGAGNVPSVPWFGEVVREAVASGIVVVNVTQCPNGSVHQTRYYTGSVLENAGVISGHDLTTEAALTKMMFLFGTGMSAAQVAKKYAPPHVRRNVYLTAPEYIKKNLVIDISPTPGQTVCPPVWDCL